MQLQLKKRKSSFDVDNATNTIVAIAFAAILLAVTLLVISIVFGLNVFSGVAGGMDLRNNTTTIMNNILGMVINFFGLMPVVGTVLAVVILIGVIVILVIYVKRMASTGSTPAAFQG